MAVIQLLNFGGAVPRLAPRMLPDNMATVAENAKLYSGELRAWRDPKLLYNFSSTTIKTAYRIRSGSTDYWFGWADHVDIVRTPLVNDSYERRYWTGDSTASKPQINSAARMIAGSPAYNLGVPQNTASITVTPSATGTTTDETRYYVITYVTAWGEEGAPCNPVSATGDATSYWTIGGLPTSAPAGYPNVTKIRIYRTITGYSSADFFYVGEKTVDSTSTYTDSLSNADAVLNNLLESGTYDPPPDNLQGLISHPNGFLVGFVGRDIYMSEPYRPHAWPVSYITSVAYDIVGLGVVGTTIIVLTTSASYALAGTHPASMTLAQNKTVEPCISKQSIVNFTAGVVYASPNGLIFTNGLETKNVTLPLFTVEDWDVNWNDSTIIGGKYGERYVGFVGKKGFILDFSSQKEAYVELTSSYAVDKLYSDELTGKLHMIKSGAVYQFDPSDTYITPYRWKSKEFFAPKPLNFGAAAIKYSTPASLQGLDASLPNQILADNAALGQPEAVLGRNVLGGGYDKTISYQPYRGVLGGSGLVNPDSITNQVSTLVFKVYADGKLVFQKDIPPTSNFRLPSGFKATRWQFEVVSNLDISSIDIATTKTELGTI